MSNTATGPGGQPLVPGIEQAVSTAIASALAESPAGEAGSRQAAVDPLRIVAVLAPVLKAELARAAASIGNSPVRATAFAHFAEELYRVAGLGQLLAAGACLEAEAHTSAETPLVELNDVLARLDEFAAGTLKLPSDKTIPPGRKLLNRDAADLLKNRLRLTYFQAKHRMTSYQRLLPHTGPTGEKLEAQFPVLGGILQNATADPKLIANTAGKLGSLIPTLNAQPHPGRAAADLEDLAARAVARHDSETVGKLIKEEESRLDRQAVQRTEAEIDPYMGLRYRGKRSTGHIWELTTDAEGHELLTTIADDLNNPHTTSGKPAPAHRDDPAPGPPADPANITDCQPGRGQGPGPDADAVPKTKVPEQPALIPEWAVDPAMPLDQRPRAGFTDVGQPAATAPQQFPGAPRDERPGSQQDPLVNRLTGESPEEANSRIRARRLLQAVFDALRATSDPQGTGDPGMPMNSRVEMLVMIDYDALRGATEGHGITGHGGYLSAGSARRLACNAGILPLVMGGNSQPLDLGRKRRFFTKGQKRAIAARDRGCINPGCGMSANRTEAHHVDPWSEGGQTRVNRGVLLCVLCHTAFHAGHFRIVFINDVPYVVQSASRDPMQRPTRNWVFHPRAAAA